MNKIPTAAEYLDNTVPGSTWFDNEAKESVVERSFSESAMIAFARMHCEAQAEAISKKSFKASVGSGNCYHTEEAKQSILNAYPLDNIK